MTSIDGFEILASSPLFFWMMAGLAVLAVTVSKSGFGGALGSLSLPLLLFVLPPKIALGVLLPLFLITDVWVVYIWRRMLDRRILMIMCGFGLLGQLLGWILFDYLSDRLLTSLIGLIATITALNYGWRRIRPSNRTSAEIAALVAQRIWQRGFVWCGLSGVLVLYRFPVGFLPRSFCYPMA